MAHGLLRHDARLHELLRIILAAGPDAGPGSLTPPNGRGSDERGNIRPRHKSNPVPMFLP